MNAFVTVLKRYATFSGRSARGEYWYFLLFYFLILIALTVLDVLTGLFNESSGIGLLTGLFAWAMFIPSLAVSIRRLHDTAHSGWWFLITFIPVIGGIWLLVYMVQDSADGDNRYGPNPKGVT